MRNAGTRAPLAYWKIPKFPRSHQSRMKISTVLMHPPPSFFAPYPAASARKSLLIHVAPENDSRFRSARDDCYAVESDRTVTPVTGVPGEFAPALGWP